MTTLPPLRLRSLDVERVWGGSRLGDGSKPIGESWGAYEGNRVAGGPLDGLTVAQACEQHGAAFLGQPVVDRYGLKFPILSKLLDTSEWLSVQVHPNDEQARELEGPEQVGKTEAWHLLDVVDGAEIILGLADGVDRALFAGAVRGNTTLDVIARQPAVAGETWFIPAGTVHALGPGLFLYEIQQASDITYRVYDWDRPASAGRELHLEQAIRCVEPGSGERQPAAIAGENRAVRLVSCPYFTLDKLTLAGGGSAKFDTGFQALHALTAVHGHGRVVSEHGSVEIPQFETVLVPASTGAYELVAGNALAVMIAAPVGD